MKNPYISRVLALLAVIAVCCLTAKAQTSPETEQFAALSANSTELRWQTGVEYFRIVLTVSTPGGKVHRTDFETNSALSFKLTDESGLRLADGQYNYELRLIPNFSQETRRALAEARQNGNALEVIRELQRTGQLPTKALVQSGSFSIENSQVFIGAEKEPGSQGQSARVSTQGRRSGDGDFTTQDQVIPDDLIVQGSACIGLDCVNNENFGFDTIRLKENNTRIKFEDTSTSAGFPTTDWQLTANDSASGGQAKFSIEDITGSRVPFTVEAGATTNSIYVDSTGKIGFRTSTPVLDLHVSTSDSPAMRLEQNAGGGFTAQTWDIAGNEANFFVRDVTSGSRLPFRIVPGAPTSSITIQSDGDVGIGTFTPSKKLHVSAGQIAIDNSQFLYVRRTNNNFQEAIGIDTNNDLTFNRNSIVAGADADAPKAASSLIFGTGAAGFMDVRNSSNATLLRVQESNGNVGIGTATPAGKLDVNGTIFQRGILLHADYVFEPTYTLESIEDHATFMWNNKHLPSMGPRTVDEQGREVVEIGARMRGMLEEIEKAHIYIEQLNDTISVKNSELSKLERQNAELAQRLARIEALLLGGKTEKK
jgi:hypothetical protein